MASTRSKAHKQASNPNPVPEPLRISVPDAINWSAEPSGALAMGGSGTTGRYLVLLPPGGSGAQAGQRALENSLGIKAINAADFDETTSLASALADEGAVIFHELGVAVCQTAPDRFSQLSTAAATESAILAIEEERIVNATGEPHMENYLYGYRDGVSDLVDRLLHQARGETATAVTPTAGPTPNETDIAWGLAATDIPRTRFSGKGVRVAVLDTGFDLQHPDFVGRIVVTSSFVENETVQDEHGHGTHCIGTACGPQHPGQLPRYGIAYDAEIYAGKVLNNAGQGTDSGILAGIQWAILNKCAVISMSLGARVSPGQTFSRVFENVAQRALAAGTLIVAAAGNDSQRQQDLILPVNHPANCPSIIAVAAIDAQKQIAFFSCGGINAQGGQVDIAGPGVDIRSSWRRPPLYRTISGTSMATPHVAGIAALWAEANSDMRGPALGWLLLQSAKRLDLPTRDVGAGLVQAPQS